MNCVSLLSPLNSDCFVVERKEKNDKMVNYNYIDLCTGFCKILATGLNRHCNDFHIWKSTNNYFVYMYMYMQHTGMYDYSPLAPIHSVIRLSIHIAGRVLK